MFNTLSFSLLQCTIDADKEFVLAPHMEQINTLFNGTSLEQIYSNLEKDGSDWSQKQLSTLKRMVSYELELHYWYI